MDEITINEWIGAVYIHLIKQKNFSEQELSKNLNKKIEQAIKDKEVPIIHRQQVADGVAEKFKKFKPYIWRVYKQKDNPNIKYCDIKDVNRHNYIDSYTNTLRENKKPESYIRLLKSNSKEIIEEFPNPKKSNEHYKIKGLVIGQIQSGKTANIEALVCRAVDFGYRFIIIMCGRTIALRQQTQLRFSNEVLTESDLWSKLTNFDKDFDAGTMDIPSNLKPHIANIAIIKKIPSTLKKIKEKIEEKPELKNHPCLIIDDECDDASIDTNANKEDFDPTKTNQEIRNLINCFSKVVYVGFSATPFANVFIDAKNEKDLYPSDFIFLLDTPKGYTGTKDFIEEYEGNFIIIHSDNEVQNPELKEAIYSFILSCCIIKEKDIYLPRNNFSMLVHPSYKKDIHSLYKRQVDEIVQGLEHYLEHPKYSNIKKEFEDLFKNHFSSLLQEVSFERIFKHYGYFVNKIETKKLNSEKELEDESQHILKYQEEDKIYIVVGGNILARGLTLEGLLTSFFVRESKGKHQYDSLLQMQRWCGFKKDYLKYTKIYTTQRLKDDLTDLVYIEEEFREEIKEIFTEKGASPSIVKPKIKNSKSMKVVSKVKQGSSFEDTYKMGLDLKILEFYFNHNKLQENINLIKEWMKDKGDNYNFTVSVKEVTFLIESYKFYNQTYKEKVLKQIQYFNDKYPKWMIELHKPNIKDSEDFYYSEKLKVKKVHRALTKKGDSLKIEILKHKLEKQIDIPKLIVYIIDEKSNRQDYKRRRKPIDKTLEAPKPIVALYFQFPGPILFIKKGTYRGQL